VDAGSVTNTATANATDPQSVEVDSSPESVTVPANEAMESLSLVKSTTSTGYGAPGEALNYNYLVTNTGTTTLSGIGVSDDLIATVDCPAAILAPAAFETCTATYTTTQADVDTGSVTNTATASGTIPAGLGGGTVTSFSSTLTILAATSGPIRITTTSLPQGTVGQPYSFALQATGGNPPYTWWYAKGGNLPKGLHFSTAGVLSGTPTKAGNYSITFRVRDTKIAGHHVNKAHAALTVTITIT
jgi:hypothetical protein